MERLIVPAMSQSPSRRNLLRGLGIGVITLGGAAACSGGGSGSAATSGSAAATSASAETALTYQLSWLKITQFAGFFCAEEKGYYGEDMIKATIDSGGPNISASQLVGAGKADLGDDDNISLLQGLAKGLPFVMFATVFQKTPYSCISKSDNPISSLQDMAGKTIAISPGGQAQLEPVLKSAGVDGVTIVPAGPDPTQLVSDQVDGYFGFATDQGVALEQQGLKLTFVSTSDLGFGGYGNVLFTTKDNLESKRDALVGFLRATIKGYEYAIANPDEAATLTVEKYGPDGLDLDTQKLVAAKQADFMTSDKGVMWIEEDTMQDIIDAQVETGTVSKSMNAADIMTTEILEAAYDGKTSLL